MSSLLAPIAALLLALAAPLPAQTPTTQTPTAQTPTAQTPTTPLPRRIPPAPRSSPPATASAPAASRPSTSRPATPFLNQNLIFLDPAHGGPDPGAHLSGRLLEKDVTLALANRLRALLAGNNLSIVLAREADAPTLEPVDGDPAASATAPTPTPDQRAGAANHLHPVACLLLHATAAGNGVHIVTSALPPPPDPTPDTTPQPVPWATAQTESLAQSLRLAHEIATAVSRARLPVHLSRASVKPIDSLTCPAVAIEIAPLLSGPTLVSDPTYQQRLAQAIATALLFWRGHADPPSAPLSPAGARP